MRNASIALQWFLVAMLACVLVLCVSGICSAQQIDVQVASVGPIRNLVRAATWNNGPGTMGNNYIVTPAYTYENVTVYITNLSTPTCTATVNIFSNGDQTITAFAGTGNAGGGGGTVGLNAAGWASVGSNGPLTFTGVSSAYYSINVVGAAHLNIQISATSCSSTGTVNLVESQLTAANYCLLPPCSSSPTFTATNAAGMGFFGPGFIGPQWAPYYGSFVDAAMAGSNTIYVFEFYLPITITVSHVSIAVSTAGPGGSTANFGIYSAGCNSGGTCSKLLDSGAIATSSTGVITVTLGTPVTLTAGGPYYYAESSTSGAVQVFSANLSTNYPSSYPFQQNNEVVAIGTASTTTAAGSMPANLGSLTASTILSNALQGIALPYFEI